MFNINYGSIPRNVFEIFYVKEYNDFEIRVTCQWRSSKVTPFDSLHYGFLLPSYSNFVSKMHLFRDMATHWSKIADKTYPTLILGRSLIGSDPLRIFRQIIPFQKLESWGYQKVYISRSCFRPARHNTGVRQTDDRHVALAKTALCTASRG